MRSHIHLRLVYIYMHTHTSNIYLCIKTYTLKFIVTLPSRGMVVVGKIVRL